MEMKLNLEMMEKSGMKINTFIATGEEPGIKPGHS